MSEMKLYTIPEFETMLPLQIYGETFFLAEEEYSIYGFSDLSFVLVKPDLGDKCYTTVAKITLPSDNLDKKRVGDYNFIPELEEKIIDFILENVKQVTREELTKIFPPNSIIYVMFYQYMSLTKFLISKAEEITSQQDL